MTGTMGSRLQNLPGGRLSIKAAWSLVGSVGGAAGRFALQIVIANMLGLSDYGRFVTFRSWGQMLANFPNRGYRGAVVRFLPGYAEVGDADSYRSMIRHSRRTTLVGGSALAVAAAAVGLALDLGPAVSVILAMAIIPILASLTMLQAILQAQDRFVTANFIVQMLEPALLAVALGVAWFLTPIDVPVALAAGLIAMLVSVLVAANRSEARTRSLVGRSDARTVDPSWGPAARSFYLGQLAIAVIVMADILILALFVSPAEVGLYSMASRIATLGRMANSGLESIVSPRIARAWTQSDVPGIQRIVSQSIAISSVPTIGFAAFLVVFREEVLGLIGDEYRAAGTYLLLLLIGNVVNALTGPSGYVVSLTGNEQLHARIMTVSAIVLVLGCFVAGPVAGTIGVAVVRTFVNVAWNLALVVAARRELGVRCYPTRPSGAASLATGHR